MKKRDIYNVFMKFSKKSIFTVVQKKKIKITCLDIYNKFLNTCKKQELSIKLLLIFPIINNNNLLI